MKYVKRLGNKKYYKPDYRKRNKDVKKYERTEGILPDYIVVCSRCTKRNVVPVYNEYCICSFCGLKLKNNTKGRFRWILKQNLNSISKESNQ